MQHPSSQQLFKYWDTVRSGRFAPNRFEIEPSGIPGILPDVFVVECPDTETCRFRLAGTRICASLGHELRGTNLLDYWSIEDREAVRNLLYNVAQDGAGATIVCRSANAQGDRVTFELLVLPLVHNSATVNRMLGSICALSDPYWLGTAQLRHLELVTFNLIWPDLRPNIPAAPQDAPPALADTAVEFTGDTRRRFRVVDGGLSQRPDHAQDV